MGSPVVCLLRMHSQLLHDLIDGETLPGRAKLGTAFNVTFGGKIHERMRHPGIANKYLGRRHLTLAKMLVQGLQICAPKVPY